MNTKNIIIFFLSLFFFAGGAYSKSFRFSDNEPRWSFYGDGLGSYVANMGRDKEQTSLWLSTDWKETATTFFTWSDLSPGMYKITTYVRAQDVQKGSEGASFMHFYDGGFGTVSPFTDLYGDYDWRKIEYTIKVKGKDLTVWFRLKSPGQVWIDDFQLEKIEKGNDKIIIELPVHNRGVALKNNFSSAAPGSRKILYNFEVNEPGHPFSLKDKSGEFSPQKFFNFNVEKMPIRNWSKFDRIEMDVYNPNLAYTNFFVTLTDDKTTNYWSQVNYKQTLAPGWNRLNFSLTQFVGERGSHRFQRSLNLSKLKKFFIVIDPDSKDHFPSESFLIDNIILSSNPMPAIPDGVMAFDFTSQKAEVNGNITPVTTQMIYNDRRGYGFVDPGFWRVEDSQYASQVLRYSIGLLRGHFKIKLPAGKYQMNLVVDKLGYWDVPFWSDRMIFVNGSPIYKETRSVGKDFLGDLLKFESIVPDLQDHPYDLYQSRVFHTISKTIDVKNGFLDIEFAGDETGISLNSLIIWNKKQDEQGLRYQTAFEKRNREEFDWMSRSIGKKKKVTVDTKLSISPVEPDLYLNPENVKKSSGTQLNFMGGVGDRPYQVIQLNPGSHDEKVSWSFSDFTNNQGEKINQKDMVLSDLVYQYTSPDMNHETYLITGKYLRPIQDVSYLLKKNRNRYLWLQLDIKETTPKGKFSGEVVFHHGNVTTKLPLEITILDYVLPKIEFPVGFFGLDPLPFSYFKGKGYSELRKKYRFLALESLGKAGFTTFTGLPSDISELDELFKESSKWGMQTVYSYGGQFPQALIDPANRPSDMSEDTHYARVSTELKKLLAQKNWPKIVHTFSDEAGGYSDKTSSDIELGKKLKKYFPYLGLAGFGSFNGGESNRLNSFFDYGFYSSLSKKDIAKLKDNNQRWGFYNAAAGNLDDPRFSFGPGLYIARANGLSQYLEWHSSAVNNYPYYDFDGRESDVVMFYPTSNGKLLHSLRFELATEGLHAFRKLKLLETAITNGQGAPEHIQQAKAWMERLKKENFFYSSTTFMSNKKFNYRDFELKLNEQLKNIFFKKKE